ncbi:hypothetical protein KQI42_04355 [Tissierella sp. MSJ-40]|uniref:Uncharacterized protein n=1 Tax=Tissierella simiarum TaxID=2841534 RepID=A0ABS6E4P6_9FIRM|nr:hypothetical protein [Tissierella simiarum]MBU5437228.1 hypothetical protein [Tissierella simiarum]
MEAFNKEISYNSVTNGDIDENSKNSKADILSTDEYQNKVVNAIVDGLDLL